MSNSLIPYIVKSGQSELQRFRDIDNHYHLNVIAQNSSQLLHYQAFALRQQYVQAAATVQNLEKVAHQQSITNNLLRDVEYSMGMMQNDVAQINVGVQNLNRSSLKTIAHLENIEAAVDDLQARLLEEFANIADQMFAQQQALQEISNTLSTPYQTQSLELRNNAIKWLNQGMNCTGQDRDEDYKDAMRLFRVVADNHIGRQDPIVWFNIGWLLWKQDNNYVDAEQAFDRARRLCGDDIVNRLYENNLRHLAHMQYLQGKFAAAFETISLYYSLYHDSEAIFDAARYAAKSHNTKEAMRFLREYMEHRPSAMARILAEEDFSEILTEFFSNYTQRLERDRENTTAKLEQCLELLHQAHKVEQLAGLNIPELAQVQYNVEVNLQKISDLGMEGLRQLFRSCRAWPELVKTVVVQHLESAQQHCLAILEDTQLRYLEEAKKPEYGSVDKMVRRIKDTNYRYRETFEIIKRRYNNAVAEASEEVHSQPIWGLTNPLEIWRKRKNKPQIEAAIIAAKADYNQSMQAIDAQVKLYAEKVLQSHVNHLQVLKGREITYRVKHESVRKLLIQWQDQNNQAS